jgi:hypothetical protein
MSRRAVSLTALALALSIAPPAAGGVRLASGGGDAVALFQPLDDPLRALEASVRPAGGRFGRPATLARGGQVGSPAVAVNARGDAVVAWHDGPFSEPRVLARLRPAGGELGPPVELARSSGGASRVAIDPSGEALVTWRERDSTRLLGAFGRPGSGFATPAPIADGVGSYDIALAPGGEAVAVWGTGTGAGGDVRAAVRPPGGAFGPPRRIGDGGGATPFAVLVDVDGTGAAIAAWRDARAIWLAERPPGGEFGAPVALPDSAGAALVTLATAGRRTLVVMHRRRRLLAAVGAGAALGEPATVARAPAPWARGAINERGDVAIAWRDLDDVRAAFRPAGGELSRLRLTAPRGARYDALQVPALALDPGGAATAAWESFRGERLRYVARGFGASGLGGARTIAERPTYLREAPARACRPPGARTLRRNRRALVVRTRGAPVTLHACLLARGSPRAIRLEGQPRRALDLAGPLVAYAATDCDVESCGTFVQVLDLRADHAGLGRIEDGGLPPDDTAAIGSLQLRANGAVAWIACPVLAAGDGVDPDCREGGSRARVFKRDSFGRRRQLLDRGRAIDATSLRLRGRRLTWRHGGRTRSATLR